MRSGGPQGRARLGEIDAEESTTKTGGLIGADVAAGAAARIGGW